MIISKKLNIKVNWNNVKKYEKLGYGKLKQGDDLELDIKHLELTSRYLIDVECDHCNTRLKRCYGDYNKSVKRSGKYYCKKCAPVIYKKTCLEKYGVDNISKLPETHLKIKKINMGLYGVDSYAKTEEFKKRHKETCLRKYGVSSFSKTSEFLQKSKITNLKNFGVENASQNAEIFSKQQKNRFETKQYEFADISYQGSYEKDFLDNYYKKLIIEKLDPIDYVYKNKNKKYFSDFYIPNKNLIVEIKSSYIYEKYKEQNLVKKKSCEDLGYGFIFIINKDYSIFEKII